MLPPIPVSKGGELAVKVGDHLNVITPDVTNLTTNNPAVLDVSQPYSDGSATFNGGATVLAVGKANLVVSVDGGIEIYTVNVTATNK